jgi:hypothetical protein
MYGGVIMAKDTQSIKDPLEWLLEPEDPGVRYLALRDLVKADARELAAAKKEAHQKGPIAVILDKMNKEGYWVKAGSGYNPKYMSSFWGSSGLP